MKAPKTLQDAIIYFSDADNCLRYMVDHRWPEGVVCPTCGRDDVTYLESQKKWQCKSATRNGNSPRRSEPSSRIPLWALRSGFPLCGSLRPQRTESAPTRSLASLGVTQKTAWFMLHRIRLAMQTVPDEARRQWWRSRSRRNLHRRQGPQHAHEHERDRRITGTGGKDKTAVMGILERGGRSSRQVVPDRGKRPVQPEVRKHVEAGAALYTDALHVLQGLDNEYIHQVIDHAVRYVNGRVHTNGMENFWSLLKRGSKWHLCERRTVSSFPLPR